MFDSLRLRLTLINIVIMAILLLLLVTATFFLMERQIFKQAEQEMGNIALAIESGSAEQLTRFDRTEYFYVKLNQAGEISKTFSSNTHTDQKQLIEMAQKIFNQERKTGDLDWHDYSYTYMKLPLKQSDGTLIIFLSIEREMNVLGFLLAALGIAGVVCLALAFYGSLYLADKALIPIKDSWQRQRDFVADASHELRTPLAVMQTNLELVMGNPKETVEEQELWLGNMQTEVSHMTKLVEDLLLLARIDSEQQLLEKTDFPLEQVLFDVINPLIPVANNKGIELKLEGNPGVYFYGDQNRIRQLILILIDNAIKYTPPGGKVIARLQNLGNVIKIIVTDTGEGIEQQHLDKIFERFYRIDKARSKVMEGTGLGLSIANWIVRSHQGSIEVTSSPGKETSFSVLLPKN